MEDFTNMPTCRRGAFHRKRTAFQTLPASGQPTVPANPEEPANPDNPGSPENPAEPDNPGSPEAQENPSNPTEPSNPGKPSDPDDPGEDECAHDYSEWEMQLIDSPLIQRLRNISQVGLAVLTYPAARHSRFEHTLGVAAATKRLVDRINVNCSKFKISSDVKNKLVLSAIMHDAGHCFYSHLSETIYGNLRDFCELRQDIKKIYDIKPKAHEILSLIIVNSDAFKQFFLESVNYPNKANLDYLCEDVGKIIIGVNIEDSGNIESYQTAIINGSFDVDKLDYIKRDSYTAGLALDFDIERLKNKSKDIISRWAN